jgi:hypothetical protein
VLWRDAVLSILIHRQEDAETRGCGDAGKRRGEWEKGRRGEIVLVVVVVLDLIPHGPPIPYAETQRRREGKMQKRENRTGS